MLTYSFNTRFFLLGCGVDAESISRFLPYVGQDAPLPLVFSPEEITHIQSFANQAKAMCAAFCCKEAVFKALGQPMNFIDCRFMYDPGCTEQQPLLNLDEHTYPKVVESRVRIMHYSEDELVAIAHLFTEKKAWQM